MKIGIDPGNTGELIHVKDNIYKKRFLWKGLFRNRYYIKVCCSVCEGDVYQERCNFKKSLRAFCSQECHIFANMGPRNPMWGGGRKFKRSHGLGHILIYAPNHPQSKKGFIPEHRLILEKKLGRFLTLEERGHHKNYDMQDNEATNLVVTSNASQHNRVHASLLKCVKPLMESGYLLFNENTMEYEVSKCVL